MARKRGNKWQASVTDRSGARHRPSFDTEAQAVAWEAQAKLAVDEGRSLPPIATATGRIGNRDLTLLGSLFQHVKRTRWRDTKGGGTATINGQTAVDYFGSNRPVSGITSVDIAEYRVWLADRGLAPATVNRKCSALSTMLRTAEEAGVISKVPKIRTTKEEQTRFRYLEQDEEAAVLSYWLANDDTDMHDLTAFLIDTGARCFSEATTAHWDAFSKDFATVTFWVTKAKRPRTVPLTSRCRDMLAARAKTHGHRAGPFTGIRKDTVRNRWVGMRNFLKLHDVTPHTMRHTCCTRLIRAGVDVKRVMTWMGHSQLTTTLRYMQTTRSGLDDIVALLEGKAA